MSRLPSRAWTIERFLDDLGSAKPVPGGGSAAAVSGCLGMELGRMVCRILLFRRRLNSKTQVRIKRDLKTLTKTSRDLRRLIHEDSQAYLGLVQARACKGGIPAARRRAIQSPMKICQAADRGMRVLKGLSVPAGPYLASDLKAAERLLQGSFEAARFMVEVNLRAGS